MGSLIHRSTIVNSSTSCLTHQRLRQLSQNELSPREMEQLDEHVTHCDACCRMLEAAAAEPDWQRELRAALSDVSDHYASPALAHSSPDDAPHDADGSVEHFVKLLGPTDDPRMLGRIGPYEIVGILGHGGMGVVFKGFDGVLNRYVAIKLLLPHLATSGAARKRFAREAQAAAAVVDDHVMAIHGVAEWQGIPYLVMPYTRGLTLQKRLNEQGPLELREVLRIGMQAAAGLAAAHAQGLVHRDVKPANMLLAEGVERVTLVDFGLARTIDDASLTQTGFLAGTPQYMSPEQARSEPVDARSDLFSLGSVLYAACTGRAPFRSETSYGVLRLITDSEPTPIRELNPDVPKWLCRIVERLMAKQPAERFSSAAEVSQLLAGCLAHVQHPDFSPLPKEAAALLPKASGSSARNSFFRKDRKQMTKILVSVVGVLGVITAFCFQSSPTNEQLAALQGEWRLVTLERDGQAKTPEELFNERLIIKDASFSQRQTAPDGTEIRGESGRLSIEQGEAGAAGTAIDFKMWEGTAHGLFQQTGEELVVCVTREGGARPDSLKTTAGDSRVLKTYRHVRKTPPDDTKTQDEYSDERSVKELKRTWTLAWMKKVPDEVPDSVDRAGAQKWLRDHEFQEIETGDFTVEVIKKIHPDIDQKSIERDGVRYFVRGVLLANRAEEKGAAVEVYFLFSEADKLLSLRVGPLASDSSDSPKQPADATREETKVLRTVKLVDLVAEFQRQLDGRWEMEPGQEPADTKIPEWGELEFRDGLLSHLRQGKAVFQGKLEIDASKSPPTFMAKDIGGGPTFIGGTLEIQTDGSLWLTMPNTKIPPRVGKQPTRVVFFRRVAADPPTQKKHVDPTKDDPYRPGPSEELRLPGGRLQSSSEQTNPLPPLDGKSGLGLKFEIRIEKNKFVVGEPVNLQCTITNTTDSLKPIGWHTSAGSHFCIVSADKAAWEGGVLPTMIPQLTKQILTKSKEGSPGQILYLPARESISILLTHKAERAEKFKGRVVYDPADTHNGFIPDDGDDGPPWKDELVSSNSFEYEVVTPE